MAGFGEHGREGARELVDVPVVDITEAAAHLACLLGRRYGVVTTLERSRRMRSRTACTPPEWPRTAPRSSAPASASSTSATSSERRGVRDRGGAGPGRSAEVLVLGCAGMTGLQRAVGEKLDLPVVDGVAAAVKLAEALVSLGLRTSRVGSYARPLPKRRVWGAGRG